MHSYKYEQEGFLKDKFYSSYYEEYISDKKENIQLEVDTFFNEMKSICVENFNNFDSSKYPETDFHFQDTVHRFSDFGLFFHKTMLEKYGKNLGKFHLFFFN